MAQAFRLVPATVLALPSATAGTTLNDLDEAGAGLSTVTTVLLVGAPTIADRAAVAEALERVGLEAVVLAVHAPDGHRLLWGECRGGQGLHTYPNLELVQLVDPETGEFGDGQGPDEVVLSQLGMRGSALLRWRTADLADWRVVVGTSQRRSTVGVVVHVVPAVTSTPATWRSGSLSTCVWRRGYCRPRWSSTTRGACPTRTGSLDASTVGSEESVRGL